MFVSGNFKRGNPGANSSFNTISTFTTINLEPTDLLFSILINFNKLVKHKFSNYPLDLKCKKLKYKPEKALAWRELRCLLLQLTLMSHQSRHLFSHL